jgi:hypothetical protein
MLRLARYNSPCCIPGSMTTRSPVGPSGLCPIHNVFEQRDGPKLFLSSMGVVEDTATSMTTAKSVSAAMENSAGFIAAVQ